MVLPTNHEAFMSVQSFPSVDGDVLALYGEQGLGKTHLLDIYKQRVSPYVFKKIQDSDALDDGIDVVCDDLEMLTKREQEKLFHMFNHIKSFGGSLLVASRHPIASLDILPDLKSRLLTGPQVEILAPTDAHLEVLLVKMASDKQMFLEPKVVQYILKNARRDIAALRHVLIELDKLSLEQKRKVTIPLVKEVLSN